MTARKMTGPHGSLLTYRLFMDSAYTVNWGNTVGVDTLAMVWASPTQPTVKFRQGSILNRALTLIQSPLPLLIESRIGPWVWQHTQDFY